MTINRSQGQTLTKMGLYLPQPVFSHGQLYVALSRIISYQCIKVLIIPYDNYHQTNCQTKNIVYSEIFQNKVIDAEIITGPHIGKRVFIPRITLSPSENSLPFTLKRLQFPIRVAFSMTINRAQGQTLNMMGLYLPQPIFLHGQLYVTLSRVI